MKKLTLATLALMIATVGTAYEIPENPDRFPSVAVGYDKMSLEGSGDQSIYINAMPLFWLRTWGDMTTGYESKVITPSVRLPLNGTFTLDLRAAIIDSTMEIKGYPTEMKYDLKGESYGAELRAYFR